MQISKLISQITNESGVKVNMVILFYISTLIFYSGNKYYI